MVVYIHSALADTPIFKRKVKMNVPEDTTVEELIDLYIKKYKLDDKKFKRAGISILVNSSRGGLKQVLKDSDAVKIFKPVSMG